MKSKRTRTFVRLFNALPTEIKQLARENYKLWKENPNHPSLDFKQTFPKRLKIWSVRIGLNYRALALRETETVEWFWLGSHSDYERILKNLRDTTKHLTKN
ncbi:MAG: hypothetical protein HW421_821 [Ignavibacteria bacterium]|nr:hypothetical protein [Ignavibacteria bacterium]